MMASTREESMHDPHEALRHTVLHRVLDGPGESDVSKRHAVAANAGLPPELRAFVEKIHRHAYRVTDDDVARLQATHSDDVLFELVVSAALGASEQRLIAGLKALEEA
jgi:hypothetical protein